MSDLPSPPRSTPDSQSDDEWTHDEWDHDEWDHSEWAPDHGAPGRGIPGTGLDPIRRPGHLEKPARSRGLELTPEELVARKRNRRWLLLIAIPGIGILVAALIASGVAASHEPSAPAAVAPAGYQSTNDGYFSYILPTTWPNNPSYTDSVGDVDHSGPTGWAGEHIGYRTSTPVLGEARPSSLADFGMPKPEPYTLSGGHAIKVTGTTTAYSYDMTRPGGFTATAVNAWNPRYGVELWLVVHASPAVTSRIVSSLKA